MDEPVTLQDLRSAMAAAFDASAAAGIDAVFRLAAGEDALLFRVCGGKLSFEVEPASRPDATFLFRNLATAHGILCGGIDPFEAFLRGDFRADGYLMWAFALMAMFRVRAPSPSG